jgi:HSP20 family protein
MKRFPEGFLCQNGIFYEVEFFGTDYVKVCSGLVLYLNSFTIMFFPETNMFFAPARYIRSRQHTQDAAPAARPFQPAVDVYETADQYHLVLAIPGVTREQFAIEQKDGILTVKGERRFPLPEGTSILQAELRTGPFQRSFQLPKGVDSARIAASYVDGLLKIAIPKAESVTQVNVIPVN